MPNDLDVSPNQPPVTVVHAESDAFRASELSRAIATRGHILVRFDDQDAACTHVENGTVDVFIAGMGAANFDIVRRLVRSRYKGQTIVHGLGFSETEVSTLRELGVEFLVDKRLPSEALLAALDSAVLRGAGTRKSRPTSGG
jgi:AmiR/NasT family two-component response regulator